MIDTIYIMKFCHNIQIDPYSVGVFYTYFQISAWNLCLWKYYWSISAFITLI